METIIRMKVDDLNKSLIDFLHLSFGGKNMNVLSLRKGRKTKILLH